MERLLGRAEVAKLLGVSVGTLNSWATTGRVSLPYIKVGKLAKYRESDIEQFVAERVVRHSGDIAGTGVNEDL